MDQQAVQAGYLLENEAVREFLRLLMENSPAQGYAYSTMARQMDSMEKNLNCALAELEEVREQLAGMQMNSVKRSVMRMADTLGDRLTAAQEKLREIKERIVEGAKEAAESFRHTGVKALGQAVSALDIGGTLQNMQKAIGKSIADVKRVIGKVEDLGHELRSAGGHIKNAGRTIAGKERREIDGRGGGRFQTAVLAPLRVEKTILDQLNNIVLAAIGNVERLEDAAGLEAGQEGTEAFESADGREKPGPPADSGKAKPSVLKDLQEKKALAAARVLPKPEQGRKSPEAAL